VTSTDRYQITHVIQVLETLVGSLDPISLARDLVTVVEVVAVPPPGDPAALRALAQGFRTAGPAVAGLSDEVRALGRSRLPQAWSGPGGERAETVVSATADLVGTAGPALSQVATALDAHADTVATLLARHSALHKELHDAWHDATHVSVLGFDVPMADPLALGRLAGSVVELITGCIGVYRRSLDAADELRGQLSDVAGRALASAALPTGTAAAGAVVLAGTTVGGPAGYDNTIVTDAQARQAAQRRDALDPADRSTVDTLLAAATSPQERAYLVKAFAAGHDVADLVAFHAQIQGRDPQWLRDHLSLIDPAVPGMLSYDGQPVVQVNENTCGSASILMARAMTDPLYAFGLTTGGSPDDPAAGTGAAFAARLRAEQLRIHDATNTLWPESLGTTPWGVAGELNRHADALGTRYDWRVVDDTNDRSVNPALADAVTAVDHGYPVPVLIGDSYPAHYVLAVAHEGQDVVLYNPSAGSVVRVSEQDFLDGRLDPVGFPHVQGVVTPAG